MNASHRFFTGLLICSIFCFGVLGTIPACNPNPTTGSDASVSDHKVQDQVRSTELQPETQPEARPEPRPEPRPEAQPEPRLPQKGSFSAVTYNVHGLPSGITKDDTNGRLTQIGPLLKPFVILGLQEVFTDDGYEILKKSFDFPTHYRYSERKEGRFMGSGLLFLSRFKAVAEKHALFSLCHGKLDNASDCLASKGFQMVRVQLAKGVELDVYNSHFEAGGGEKDSIARTSNVEEVQKAMQKWSTGRAILFLGDTNLKEQRPNDKKALDTWLQTIQLKDSCEAVQCPKKGRIDRIFFRSSKQLILEPKTWSIPKEFIDKKGVPLSDHDPIVVQFDWKEQR